MSRPFAAAFAVLLWAACVQAQTPLTTEVVASFLPKPVWAGHAPADAERLFIVLQHEADVVIMDLETGTLDPTPFLDLSDKVDNHSGDRGLLGMAFDPAYASTRHFFLFYTRKPDSALIVERYTALAGNPDLADPSSGVVILGPLNHPDINHNGGHITFGPDGKLYVGIGDGGGSGDTGPGHQEPGGNAQYGLTLLGKLLRINKNGTVPNDNPFVGNPNYLPQIWATGLRNPWRYSFDSETGDLWIADVGEADWEEIDFVAAGSGGGQNFGWRCMEGFACTGLGGCNCGGPALTSPIQSYGHSGGKCSITGGGVYRGDAIPDLAGTYFYADYCSFQVFSLRFNGTAVTEFTERTAELETPGLPQIQWVTSFGEDPSGEIYIIDHNDEVFRVVPAGPFTGLGHALPGTNGAPILHGEGTLVAGTSGSLELNSARSSTPAMLFISLGAGSGAPFKGGTLVAVPYVMGLSLITGPGGSLNLNWTAWPGGLPPGLALGFQYAILDPAAVWGVSLSNALRADLP